MTAPNRNITLSIGGRSHVIAIAPEEADHVAMLAQMIDDRVRTLGVGHGQTEARMLVIAALMLADELHTLKNGAPVAEKVTPEPQAPEPQAPEPQAPEPAILLQRVASLADRVEKLAARLEHLPDHP
jgi:cell division protein ZapA